MGSHLLIPMYCVGQQSYSGFFRAWDTNFFFLFKEPDSNCFRLGSQISVVVVQLPLQEESKAILK